MPWAWLLAGPNGSGKSTLAKARHWSDYDPDAPSKPLCADELAKIMAESGVDQTVASYSAALAIDNAFNTCLEERRPIIVETVLSSTKYFKALRAAKAGGLNVGIVYVTLPSAIEHIARVADRVRKNGHDVARDKIIARRRKSHQLLWQIVDICNVVHIYDNSRINGPVRVAKAIDGVWTDEGIDALPDLATYFHAHLSAKAP